jgi:hypothetical protein
MSSEAQQRVKRRVTDAGSLPVSRDNNSYAAVMRVLQGDNLAGGEGLGGGGGDAEEEEGEGDDDDDDDDDDDGGGGGDHDHEYGKDDVDGSLPVSRDNNSYAAVMRVLQGDNLAGDEGLGGGGGGGEDGDDDGGGGGGDDDDGGSDHDHDNGDHDDDTGLTTDYHSQGIGGVAMTRGLRTSRRRGPRPSGRPGNDSPRCVVGYCVCTSVCHRSHISVLSVIAPAHDRLLPFAAIVAQPAFVCSTRSLGMHHYR